MKIPIKQQYNSLWHNTYVNAIRHTTLGFWRFSRGTSTPQVLKHFSTNYSGSLLISIKKSSVLISIKKSSNLQPHTITQTISCNFSKMYTTHFSLLFNSIVHYLYLIKDSIVDYLWRTHEEPPGLMPIIQPIQHNMQPIQQSIHIKYSYAT